ncbi:DUF1700 domain-containing protein [Acetobacterium sp.]|jgi:uncharacterized membrane protein|uniref:DUF1700 domain-containing protein n=1 Tax=Acetobacterium sp. TaxID=1872094 RepID=UPI000CA658B5|nr:DUF1700 domain-containing protein [Acetobacterium sp.]MDO9492517.1 DUF1700 domain-containing protein [Acetobacterium sp.]PKM72683.1 MAG: hypothetical protein CVU92_07205 [Firmicutes bacterium HGW-Firmicutes-17]
MNKTEFLLSLEKKLVALPPKEIEVTQGFYAEMIDDRIEDGMGEEEAVAAIGDIDTIVQNTLLELPLPTLMKAKIQPKAGLKLWEIVLMVLGFPLWFPLLAAFFIVILAVYVSVWAVIISLYASVAAFVLSGVAGIFSLLFAQSFPAGLLMFGLSLICIGIGVLAFFGVTKLSVWLISLTRRFLRWVKSLFIKKEIV